MGLSGNLESFGVPEILQLLALQRKSGVLRLTRHNGEKQVLFLERGRIVATRDRRDTGPDPFLRFLRGANYLTDEQVTTITRIQAESGRDSLYIMLSGGMVGRDRLVEALSQHTQQIVDGLLAWTQGSYEFSGDDRSIPKLALKAPLSIEELLMEGMRRMDELATIKQAVLAPDLHLLRSSEPLDRSTLTRELLVVHDLVTGTTSVEELVEMSPLGEYSTYEAISTLLEMGRLVVDPCPPAEQPPDLAAPAPLAVTVPIPRRPITSTWMGVVGLSVTSLILGLTLGRALQHKVPGFLPREVQEARERANEALAAAVSGAPTGTAPVSEPDPQWNEPAPSEGAPRATAPAPSEGTPAETEPPAPDGASGEPAPAGR